MYVAVTRARNRLYMCFAQTRMLHGQTRYNLPSRFIEEIPSHLLKFLPPKRAAVMARAVSPAPSFAISARGATRAGRGVFQIGQSVIHPKFGSGVVINAEGQGGDARLQINFGAEGVKWLMVEMARLEPRDD